VERALLALGAEDAEADGHDSLPASQARGLEFERGRLLYPRQWYLGFCRALRLIEAQLAACPPHCRMSSPAEIAVMFDKPRCHERLAHAGVPVPRALGVVASYDELLARMREAGCGRVFVKLAHGSSAAGVVAYQTDGRRHQAATTVEIDLCGMERRLYNSRRIWVYRDPAEVAGLIDALCRHRVHVEQWLPKAGLNGQTFDLRVVVIDGEARHVGTRLSRGPMTNLHLLNDRADAFAVQERMGPAAWHNGREACVRAMCCFPESLYGGIDLLIAPGFRRCAVLEVNAFGDLLQEVLWRGETTHEVEVRAMLAHSGIHIQ
jgi:hypothetical protein